MIHTATFTFDLADDDTLIGMLMTLNAMSGVQANATGETRRVVTVMVKPPFEADRLDNVGSIIGGWVSYVRKDVV